jgi:cytochrome c556
MKRSFWPSVALPLIIFSLSACTDSELRDGVSRFNNAVQSSLSSIKTTYGNVNDQIRHRYFEELLLTPGMKAEEVDTSMINHYSDDYIQARLLAFNALASYTAGLASLASSTAPADAEAAIQATGNKLSTLSTQIQALTKSSKNLQVAQFSTPISQLVGLLADQLLEMAKDNYLRQDLKQSNKSVDDLCQALEDDLNEMANVASLPQAEKILALYRLQYNGDPKLLSGPATDGLRASFLKDYETAAKDAADITATNAAPLVEQIRTVHNKLIQYLEARQSKSKFSLHGRPATEGTQIAASLSSDLNDFEAEATSLANAVNRIPTIK